jgi:hypothetical protein
MEDAGITAAELAAQGIPAAVIDAVELLTRCDHVSPADYYQHIREHPTAREVKLADLADNTDPERMATLSESDRARLTRKYADAHAALGADFDDGTRHRSRVPR